MKSVVSPEEEFKFNDDTSLYACKVPTKLEVGKNPAAESSPASENEVSEAMNEGATEIEDLEDESLDESPPLCI